jgi:hypothetical protein
MKRCMMTICFAALAVSAALAQEKKNVPLPPKPADDRPSLEVTMKFIQDKLNAVGPVNLVAYVHDNVAGNDWTNQSKTEFTKVVADPGACRIGYHVGDYDGRFLLKDIEDIIVMPVEQRMKEVATANGHPSWSYRVDPPVFALHVRKFDDKVAAAVFLFFDEQLANRVAKAMVHAVELCGGGSRPEPF